LTGKVKIEVFRKQKLLSLGKEVCNSAKYGIKKFEKRFFSLRILQRESLF